jgi:hypothetical protein
MRRYFPAVVVASVLLPGCQGPSTSKPLPPAAAPAPEYRLRATIKDIMDAFVDPGADYIWDSVATTVTAKGTVEKYPRTDEEWAELRRRAIHVMEGANLLLIPGRHVANASDKSDPRIELPPDRIEALINQDRAAFTERAHALFDSVLPVLQAVDAKDRHKLLEASDGIDAACENCHLKYWYPPK